MATEAGSECFAEVDGAYEDLTVRDGAGGAGDAGGAGGATHGQPQNKTTQIKKAKEETSAV